MMRSALASFLLLVVGVGTCSADLMIAQYTPQQNDRYYAGADKAFVAQGYDLSGVAKNTATPVTTDPAAFATLITPNFALAVGHADASGLLTFINGNDPNAPGAVVTANTAAAYQLNNLPGDPGPSDLVLIRLSTPVTTITPFSLIADEPSGLLGQQMFVYGQTNRVGTNNVSGAIGLYGTYNNTTTAGFSYTYDPKVSPNEAAVVGGDSGGPSFVRDSKGGISLLGLHEGYFLPDDKDNPFPGLRDSVDVYLPYYIPIIQAEIASLGYSDKLSIHTLQSVPEPGSLVLLSIGLGGASYAGGRRRAAGGDR